MVNPFQMSATSCSIKSRDAKNTVRFKSGSLQLYLKFLFSQLVLEPCDWEGIASKRVLAWDFQAITSANVNMLALYSDFPVVCWFEFYCLQR